MISPGPVRPDNCFFAMAAMLNKVWVNKDKISKIYCPGLAYRDWKSFIY